MTTHAASILVVDDDANICEVRTVLITGSRADAEPSIQRLCEERIDAICYKPPDVSELMKTIGLMARTRGRGRILDFIGIN